MRIKSISFLLRDAIHSHRKMSVCLSVCHTPVFCRSGSIYHLTCSPSSRHTILIWFLQHQTLWQHSDGDPLTGASSARGIKTSRFSTNVRNDTRYCLRYYRRRIGNRTQTFEWYGCNIQRRPIMHEASYNGRTSYSIVFN